MRLKKSQSIIDFVLVFIAVAALSVGIVRIWVWFNVNYAGRQQAYQNSRLLAAGRPRPYDANQDTPTWPQTDKPVDIGATKKCPDCEYKPLDLTEKWVFQGEPSGTIPLAGGGGTPGSIPSLGECAKQCEEQCKKDPACIDDKGNFNARCACYKECYAPCLCQNQIQSLVTAYTHQIEAFCGTDDDCRPCSEGKCVQPLAKCTEEKDGKKVGCPECTGQACQFRRNAQSMVRAAEKCDDPWEFCWWGNWGRLSRELRQAAANLRKSAYAMEKTGSRLQASRAGSEECCKEKSETDQKRCFERLKATSDCDKACFIRWQAVVETCFSYRDRDSQDLCMRTSAEREYNQCMSECKRDDAKFCAKTAQAVKDSLMARIKVREEDRAELQKAADELQNEIDDCSRKADKYARSVCGGWSWSYYNRSGSAPSLEDCYQTEYKKFRNQCCYDYAGPSSKGTPKEKDKWKRYCDEPMAGCDMKKKGCDQANPEAVAACPPCSLKKLISDYQERIKEIDKEIARLKEIIPKVDKCCPVDCSKLTKPKDKEACRENQNQCFSCAQTDCSVSPDPQQCLTSQEKCLKKGGAL